MSNDPARVGLAFYSWRGNIYGIMEPTTYLWAGAGQLLGFLLTVLIALEILKYIGKQIGLIK